MKFKLLLILLLIFAPHISLAMSSETYKINADVVGAGGNLGTSETYKLTDTLGQPVIGIGGSETYNLKAGFWYMVNYALSLSVDSNTVNLGTITPGTPTTGQSILTVTTDSWGGYDLFTSQNHSMMHTDATTTIPDYSCAIANPCLWSGTGLGFTLTSGTQVESKWGSTPNFKYAAFPLSATIFHTKTGYTSGGDQTTVGYKLDTPATQKSGAYSNIITYTATSKL